jgi:hypothetical protein
MSLGEGGLIRLQSVFYVALCNIPNDPTLSLKPSCTLKIQSNRCFEKIRVNLGNTSKEIYSLINFDNQTLLFL